MKKIKKFFKDFADSFKPKISWLYIILFDLLFYGITVLLVKGVGSYLAGKSNAINLPVIEDLTALTAEQVQPIASQVQSLVISTILLSILIFVVILGTWSLSRGLIYSILLKKEFNKKSFKKFILLNLFLFVVITIILTFFTAIGLILQELVLSYRYVFYLVFLVIAYYLSINYIIFTKHNKVFESIGKALEFGTKNMPKLLIPCLLILIVSLILTNIQPFLGIPLAIAPFVSLIVFVIFMAWARIYFVHKVEEIKES